MAQTPEGKVKVRIKKFLKEQGAYQFSPIGGPYAVHGVPDIICCVRGHFVGIEVKAPGREKNTTANQDMHLDRILEAGGVSIVASSVERVRELFADNGWLRDDNGKP